MKVYKGFEEFVNDGRVRVSQCSMCRSNLGELIFYVAISLTIVVSIQRALVALVTAHTAFSLSF